MKPPYYIAMFSIHGLLRGKDLEMGRDADTGGQIKYIVELARELGKHPEVKQVDLFTRLIDENRYSDDYAQEIEELGENSRIVRIRCGGTKYIKKENLWSHLDEYIDKTLKFFKNNGISPDIIHGHYADAGYVSQQLAALLNTPFIFTGHSLGKPKEERLKIQGMVDSEIQRQFKMAHRQEVEETILKHADLIVTSTSQEIEKQYGLYKNKSFAQFKVMPPGIDTETFYPYYHNPVDHQDSEEFLRARSSTKDELNRFYTDSSKPIILALCRAEKRKNIRGLIEAYGKDLELQAIANLAIFAGIRKNILDMDENEKDVLTEMLLLMDQYDLYGKMAIPKKHDFTHEVPELYRSLAEHKGVFVNVALTEPFGLTLLEASSCGIPIIATNDGGPRDIISNCKNGILVDPEDQPEISNAIRKLIVNKNQWNEFSKNGIEGIHEHYIWTAHVNNYIEELHQMAKPEAYNQRLREKGPAKRLLNLNSFFITDIDNTLLGDDKALKDLIDYLNKNKETLGFGVATGRTIDSTLQVLKEKKVPLPDVIISSVGAEIYYSKTMDRGWKSHISRRWNRDNIVAALKNMKELEYQEEDTQRDHKVSYYVDPEKDTIANVHELLQKSGSHYNLIHSHRQFLDILPYRASKGKAIRYLSYKWEIPLDNIIVAGDSGNDYEMLKGSTRAIVVANYSEELEALRGKRRVFFASENYAKGILEGLEYYKDAITP